MHSTKNFCVTVFGGTGFLGRNLVNLLARQNYQVRVAVRNPRHELFRDLDDRVDQVYAELQKTQTVVDAIKTADGVVNAVGMYQETPDVTFDAIHVDGARRVAEIAEDARARLVHISGIGVDPDSPSNYIRARAIGEQLVRATAANAVILRPSVLFGPNDSFLRSLCGLVRGFPIIPLFGKGDTKLQPVHVEDVACAIASIFGREVEPAPLYELGGPRVYRYRDLLMLIATQLQRKRLLLPVPFVVWRLLATLASVTPNPPITGDQVALMRHDNIADSDIPGFKDLGIEPRALEEVLSHYLTGVREHDHRSSEHE
jgi:NADH dehydrogenase